MSSSSDESDSDRQVKTSKKAQSQSKSKGDYQIKPSKGGPTTDTSKWPLLLKVIHSYPSYILFFSPLLLNKSLIMSIEL